MTPSQLQTAARQRYNAVGDSFWSDEEIYRLIYTACLEFARETLCIERVYSSVSVASQTEYAYPTNTISIKRVVYNGRKLTPITQRENDALTVLSASVPATGVPECYSVWDETLYLVPTPDTSDLTIEIFSYNEPQEVSNTSVLEIPSQFHMDILNYILSEMYAKDKDFAAARYYRDLWTLTLQNGKKWTQKRKRGDAFIGIQDVETLNERIIGNM